MATKQKHHNDAKKNIKLNDKNTQQANNETHSENIFPIWNKTYWGKNTLILIILYAYIFITLVIEQHFRKETVTSQFFFMFNFP